MELKNILRRLIKEREISVSQVAKATKVPSQTIHNWLAGTEPKSFTQVKRVADFFEVSLDYICFGNHKERGESTTKPDIATIQQYNDEINAGVFEVVLRRVKKK